MFKMSQNQKLDLNDLIFALEIGSMDIKFYINSKTNKIQTVTYLDVETYEACDEDDKNNYEGIQSSNNILEEIECSNDWIMIPELYSKDTWNMMVEFCFTIEDKISEILLEALKGRGAFRRFKHLINQYGISQEWYDYHNEQLKQYARDWCDMHNIEYCLKPES